LLTYGDDTAGSLGAERPAMQARHLDTHHLMSGSRCTQRISVGESMTQAITCGIGMALDNS
jgi:hypothetical protein